MSKDLPQEPLFLPIKIAAQRLGLPYWKLLRACKAGSIPTYRLLNSKRYVKLADIEAVLRQAGGAHD